MDLINESYIINTKDILYNKKAFDNGEINLCFITGFSGSGKSTMANEMEKSGIEKYELDDITFQFNFSDDNLKEYGNLISSFFRGSGKKYRMKEQPSVDNNWLDDTYTDEFEKNCIRDFVFHSIKYANSHKDSKFVIEGVELYWFFEPKELDEYAVYIKGTSTLLSMIRGAKRDSSDADTKGKRFKSFIKNMLRKDRAHDFMKTEKVIKKWRNYYKESLPVEESLIPKPLNGVNKESINEGVIRDYLSFIKSEISKRKYLKLVAINKSQLEKWEKKIPKNKELIAVFKSNNPSNKDMSDVIKAMNAEANRRFAEDNMRLSFQQMQLQNDTATYCCVMSHSIGMM
jgi:dephospho-CoA kinase